MLSKFDPLQIYLHMLTNIVLVCRFVCSFWVARLLFAITNLINATLLTDPFSNLVGLEIQGTDEGGGQQLLQPQCHSPAVSAVSPTHSAVFDQENPQHADDRSRSDASSVVSPPDDAVQEFIICPSCVLQTPYLTKRGNLAQRCEVCQELLYVDAAKNPTQSTRSRSNIPRPPWLGKLVEGSRASGNSQRYVSSSSTSPYPEYSQAFKAKRKVPKDKSASLDASVADSEIEEFEDQQDLSPRFRQTRLKLAARVTPAVDDVVIKAEGGCSSTTEFPRVVADPTRSSKGCVDNEVVILADIPAPKVNDVLPVIATLYSPHLVVCPAIHAGLIVAGNVDVNMRLSVKTTVPIPLMTKTPKRGNQITRICAFQMELITKKECDKRLAENKGAYIFKLSGKYRGCYGDSRMFVERNECPASMANCMGRYTPVRLLTDPNSFLVEPNCRALIRDDRLWLVPLRPLSSEEHLFWDYDRDIRVHPWSDYPPCAVQNYVIKSVPCIPFPVSFDCCVFCIPFVCLSVLKRHAPTNTTCQPGCTRRHPLPFEVFDNKELLKDVLTVFWPRDELIPLAIAQAALRKFEAPILPLTEEYYLQRDELLADAVAESLVTQSIVSTPPPSPELSTVPTFFVSPDGVAHHAKPDEDADAGRV